MRLPIRQVDAFADAVFGGNPAAVVRFDAPDPWPDDARLLAIARENNLSETAYVRPVAGDPGRFALRWFTPALEVDLCGHATLAAGFVVLDEDASLDAVRFDSASGELAVSRGEDGTLEMRLPNRAPRRLAEAGKGGPPDGLLDALGLAGADAEVLAARDHVVVVRDEGAVRALAPDLRRLAAVDAFGVAVAAVADEADLDVVARYFAPKAGVDEDPVTGSTWCTLGPLFAERLGRDRLRCEQGGDRRGRLEVRVADDAVTLVGRVAPYLRGTIEIA